MATLLKTSFFLFIFLFFYDSGVLAAQKEDSLVILIEDYILEGQADSAKFLMNGEEKHESYLDDLVNGPLVSYENLTLFINSIHSRIKKDRDQLNAFVSSKLIVPQNEREIDVAFGELIFHHVSNLRNNNQLDEANAFHGKMTTYLANFENDSPVARRMKALSLVHPMVIKMIQGKLEESEKKGLEIVSIGEMLRDTAIIIMGNFHLYHTYTTMRNLEKSIYVAEEVHRLEGLLQEKTDYYYENLFQLINLYDYMDKQSDKIPTLLFELYENKPTRKKSYELFARHLRAVRSDSVKLKKLFDLLEVNSILEFSEKAEQETEKTLLDYDRIYLLNELAGMLKDFGFLLESNNKMQKALNLTRSFYSKELSESLAKYESDIIRKEKEAEVINEKEKTKTFAIVLALIASLFVVSSIAWIRVRKQKGILQRKNTEIEEQKSAIEQRDREKQLLLKEVHHRVKNNFQIISSLLELQSKGIEDEKAKELAQEGKNRVKSMALIHQKLYQNDDLLIYFDDYIEKLVKEITAMYGLENKPTVSIKVPKLAFDIDTAIPLGLIVNELVTNAFKYGGAAESNKVNISIHQEQTEGNFRLEVEDSGKGMPEGFDFSKAKSMGLRLVRSLSKQLQGSVSYTNNQGAIFSVLFKNSSARALID